MKSTALRQRQLTLLICSTLTVPFVHAQTTVTLGNLESNGNNYDTSGNPLTLDVPTGSSTITGLISGTGNVQKTGAGSLYVTKPQTFSGDFSIDGGLVNLAGTASMQNLARVFSGNSIDGILQVTGGSKVTASTAIVAGNNNGVNGRLEFSGSNTQVSSNYYLDVGFNGTGVLEVTSGAYLRTSKFLRAGVNSTGVGSLSVTGSGTQVSIGEQLELGTYGRGTLTLSDNAFLSAASLDFNKLGTGSGTVNLNSSAVLLLNGNIKNYGAANTATFNLSGGTLRATAVDWSSSVPMTLSNTSTVDAQSSKIITLAGALSGTGSLTKTGTGNLILTGNNTYSGGTTITAGNIQIQDANSLGTGMVTVNGGGLLWGGSGVTADLSGSLNTIGSGGATFDVGGNNVSFANAITASGTITKRGSGTLSLSGSNNFPSLALAGGTLAISDGGTLQLGGGNSLTSSSGGALAMNASTLKLTGNSFTSVAPVALTGNVKLDTNGFTGAIYAPISGSGGFTKIGAGVLTVTNNNTFSGPVTVNTGTLVVSTAKDLGTGNGDVTVNAGAFLAAASNLEFARNVTVAGSDAVTVSPNHLEVGSAGNGSLSISNGAIVGSGSTTTLAYYGADNGSIDASGSNSVLYAQTSLRVGYGGTGTLSVSNGATANAQSLVLGVQAGSSGTLNLNSGGILQVGGADGITIGSGNGQFNLAGGTLRVGGDTRVAQVPASSSFNLTNLANDIKAIVNANVPQNGDGGLSSAIPMVLSNSSTIDTNGSTATLAGTLSGTGSLTKTGNGTLTLTGSNTYTGATTVASGTLALGASGSLSSGTIHLGTSGTLDLTAKSSFSLGTTQTLSGTGLITLGTGKTLTLAGPVSPGNSIGKIHITGNASLDSTSAVTMELSGTGGTAGTDFDQLDISGTLALNGAVNIVLLNGFTPALGNSFQIFKAGSVSGTPSSINLPALGANLKWNTSNLDSTGVISVVTTNRAPSISGTPATEITEGNAYQFSPVATDPDSDTLSFSIVNKPEWASFSTSTGALSGTPEGKDIGNISNIQISVSDGNLSSSLAAFGITVVAAPLPEPPQISDLTTNVGTLTDPVIQSSGILQGGTISGTVQNSGLIQNVILAPGTQVTGGKLSGTISGSAGNPAVLNNTQISVGSRLENVVIGLETSLAPGVELGENVRFVSADAIPVGLDLTSALGQLAWGNGSALQVVNLNDDILLGGGSSKPSLLQSIQLLAEFDPSGFTADQGEDGELLVVNQDLRAAVIPVRVLKADPAEKEGAYVDDNADIVIITANGRKIISHPALQDEQELLTGLTGLGLGLSYDGNANLIISANDFPQALHNVAGAQQLAIAQAETTYYAARPDVIARPAAPGSVPGMRSTSYPGLPHTEFVTLTFTDASGVLLEQRIVPVPADWPLLKQTLEALPDMNSFQIDAQGIISGHYQGVEVRALSEFRVVRSNQAPSTTDRISFQNAGDVNGDGRNDFLMVYPNGDQQTLLMLP